MRKFFAVLLVLLVFAIPACAEDAFSKQVQIGRDKAGLTWYLTDYGNGSAPYAVARKYYTSAAPKTEQIEELMSRYSVSEKAAKSLYFTESRYEFSDDGTMYTEVYRKHFDMLGNEILGLVSSRSNRVVKNSIMSKGYAYAVGRLKK